MDKGGSARLHPIEASHLQARRERVFLVFAGLFLGTLAMLNILGISRFIKFASFEDADGLEIVFAAAVGVLPYPVTFLCTDFISEFYGRKRANFVVFVGFLLNLWVVFILWLGGVLPGFEPIDPATGEIVRDAADRLPVFYEIRALTFGAVTASMIAYLAAQFCDVYLFHFWKKVTRGKWLWVRNNGSTMVSQLVDTTAVILITHFYAGRHDSVLPRGESPQPVPGDRPDGRARGGSQDGQRRRRHRGRRGRMSARAVHCPHDDRERAHDLRQDHRR